jgi:hypothetical protein
LIEANHLLPASYARAGTAAGGGGPGRARGHRRHRVGDFEPAAQRALFGTVKRAMDDGPLTPRSRDEVRDAMDEAEKAFHAWAAADFTSVRLPA